MNLHDIRVEYSKQSLSCSQCADKPLLQFKIWLEEAIKAQVNEPTAMNVATVDDEGLPDSRVVLLKEVNDCGFIFFTNYLSQKGRELKANPFVALNFFWAELERQVRIRGHVVRLSEYDSDVYFESRPYASKIGAWASEQSTILAHKSVLLARAAMFGAKYPVRVPRPPHWGGYCVIPERVEFWQGRPSRLHDRIVYRLEQEVWFKERLAP